MRHSGRSAVETGSAALGAPLCGCLMFQAKAGGTAAIIRIQVYEFAHYLSRTATKM
jgi:hypothetical protein